MKSLLFCGKVNNKNINRETNLKKVGLNTGNLLFWYSLNSFLDVDAFTLDECYSEDTTLSDYSSFITTDLIWIEPNKTYENVWSQLKMAGNKPLIPISIGLHNWSFDNEFIMNPDTVKLLQTLQERCVLGVRGNYTASVLEKHGISNVDVVGCPSLYYPFDYSFKIRRKEEAPKSVTVNLRSMYSELDEYEVNFLKYAAKNSFDFCEQTGFPFSLAICKDCEVFELLNGWLNLHKMMFFDVNDWRSFAATQDFSMGERFHGNVISLWEGVPALFFTIDTRTSEMCEFFRLPTMKIEEFDPDKDIRYYYNLADYSEFNKNYPKNLNRFIDFLKKNRLSINKRHDGWYDHKIYNLEKKVNEMATKKKRWLLK